ncbi:hypothetical protein ACVWW3_005349 [Bradyrhizobium sp. LM2.9]
MPMAARQLAAMTPAAPSRSGSGDAMNRRIRAVIAPVAPMKDDAIQNRAAANFG